MPRAGDVVGGRYRMIEPMASGGMGTVWRAHHTELEVDVALKLMSQDTAADSSGQKRFRREAQAGAQLKSPHIVHVHDYGIHEDQPYLAMELLQGEDLQARLDEHAPLPLEQCATIVEGVAKAVQLAHDHGIIHRDLKPGNIFLATQGDESIAKVLDFGIAKDVRATADPNSTTGAGILGSPAYMSPEQVWGEPLDHTTDLWSLGVVAFEMLTGTHPFADEKLPKTFDNIIHEALPKPSDFKPELSAFDAFFAKVFEREPKERIASARDFAEGFLDAIEATGPLPAGSSPKTKPPSSRRSARRSGRERPAPEAKVDAPSPVDAAATTLDAAGPRSADKEPETSVPAATGSAPQPKRQHLATAAMLAVAAIVVGIVLFASGESKETTGTQGARPGPSTTAAAPPAKAPTGVSSSGPSSATATAGPDETATPDETAKPNETAKPESPPPRVKAAAPTKKPAPPSPPPSSTTSEVDPLFGIPTKSQK